MQERINSFNAAFIDLAVDYVNRVAIRAARKEPETKGAAQQFRYELANEIQLANLLAVTIGKMQEAQWRGTSAGPEPVTMGPGTYLRMEKTSVSGPRVAEDGKKTDVLFALKELCRWSRSREDGGDYRWKRYTEALEFAIPILSELEEMREVHIQPIHPALGTWELMRDILAGRRPAPEGTVFDVVIDMNRNLWELEKREEPEQAPRMLEIAMPGGETVKLNSAAEAYKLAGCIEEMTARVWPEAAPGK